MATHIQLDALGGIAGDMFIASVLDAWPELLDDTIAAIRAAGENLDIVGISLADHRDDVFAGQRFANFENSESELEQHRTLEDIESILRESSLDRESTERAISIFRILADHAASPWTGQARSQRKTLSVMGETSAHRGIRCPGARGARCAAFGTDVPVGDREIVSRRSRRALGPRGPGRR